MVFPPDSAKARADGKAQLAAVDAPLSTNSLAPMFWRPAIFWLNRPAVVMAQTVK